MLQTIVRYDQVHAAFLDQIQPRPPAARRDHDRASSLGGDQPGFVADRKGIVVFANQVGKAPKTRTIPSADDAYMMTFILQYMCQMYDQRSFSVSTNREIADDDNGNRQWSRRPQTPHQSPGHKTGVIQRRQRCQQRAEPMVAVPDAPDKSADEIVGDDRATRRGLPSPPTSPAVDVGKKGTKSLFRAPGPAGAATSSAFVAGRSHPIILFDPDALYKP